MSIHTNDQLLEFAENLVTLWSKFMQYATVTNDQYTMLHFMKWLNKELEKMSKPPEGDMTEVEMRVMLAAAEGYEFHPPLRPKERWDMWYWPKAISKKEAEDIKKGRIHHAEARLIPDYPKDLNAIHRVETLKWTDGKFWRRYVANLAIILELVPANSVTKSLDPGEITAIMMHAEPEQRAEALCLALKEPND